MFVFSGQGSHWAGMGRQLLVDEPVFAEAIAELDPIFVEQVGFSLQQIIANGEPISGDAQVQPVLMGLQLALTELWRSYGVQPGRGDRPFDGRGHRGSGGRCASVVDGLRVIATGRELMSQLAGQGAVALLKLDAEATEALIADLPGRQCGGLHLAARDGDRRARWRQVDAVIAAVAAEPSSPVGSTWRSRRTPRSWIRSWPNCVRRWPI